MGSGNSTTHFIFMKKDRDLEKVKAALTPKVPDSPFKNMLSSGSTLINLACSGRPHGAFSRGSYNVIAGDSSSGKTALTGSIFAEATINPKFDEYDLIFDNIEQGALMFEKFFGPKVAARIKAPKYVDGLPVYSETAEDLYANLHRCLKRPCIYIADSETALTTEAEKKKQKSNRKAISEDGEQTGSMTDGKAKIHSTELRGVQSPIRRSGSIVIFLLQTRANMGFGAKFNPKVYPGGKALKFYAMIEMWSSITKKLTKVVNDKTREIGTLSRFSVEKNRLTGRKRAFTVPIYHSFGFDDVGSCVDYLIEENHWRPGKVGIKAPEFNFEGSRNALIKHIEATDGERELRSLVGEVCNEIEAKCTVERKNRYF